MHQRLRDEHAVAVSPTSLRRYVALELPQAATRQRATALRPEVPPGEAQIDYGHLGGWVDPAGGRVRRVHAFVLVLACSRHMFVQPALSMDQSSGLDPHVHQPPPAAGRPARDRAKIAAEERLNGKYQPSTSDTDLLAEDVALGYKNLLEAERGFCDLKSTLELRPVLHRIEPPIRAHALLCWLALLLIRVAERRTGLSWPRIAPDLGLIHAVTLLGTAGSVTRTTPLSEAAAGILQAFQVTPPPAVTAVDLA